MSTRQFICYYEDFEDRELRMASRIYAAVAVSITMVLLVGGIYLGSLY